MGLKKKEKKDLAIDTEKCNESDVQRDTWKYHVDYIFSILGFVIGFGNIWRFPYMVMRHGGGAFLIPYFLFLILCGCPLMFLEMGMGQFSSLGPISVWRAVPIFKGLGWGCVMFCFIFATYYNTILAWVLYYLFNSFTTNLPWTNCDNPWNTEHCFRGTSLNETGLNGTSIDSIGLNSTAVSYTLAGEASNLSFGGNITENSTALILPSEEFWQYKVLALTDGIHDMGGVRWELLGCLVLSWVMVFLGLVKGTRSLNKCLYVTVPLPFICLGILFIRGITLPGSLDGILFYLDTDWDKLLTFAVWADACSQIFYSLGPAWGVMYLMASYGEYKNDCQRDAIVLSVTCCLTSLFNGFVVFSILGFLARELGVEIEDVIKSGPGLVFITYPEALSRLPLPTFWAILFFFMLLTVGIDGTFAAVETLSMSIADFFPNTLLKRRALFTGFVCILLCLAGIPYICNGGIYIFVMVDWYCAVFSLWLIAILETLGWFYVYGIKNVFNDIELMLGRKPYFLWKVCWCSITPIMLTVVLVWSLVQIEPPTLGEYHFPPWVTVVGWMIALAPTAAIVGHCCINVILTKGTIRERMKNLITPERLWGPARASDREGTKYEREGDVTNKMDSQALMAPESTALNEINEQNEYSTNGNGNGIKSNGHSANGNGCAANGTEHAANGNRHAAKGNGHATNGNGHAANGNGNAANGNGNAANDIGALSNGVGHGNISNGYADGYV